MGLVPRMLDGLPTLELTGNETGLRCPGEVQMTVNYTRRHPRVHCGVKGRLEASSGSMRGMVRTISPGGSFFVGSKLLPVGEMVELRIELPGIRPVNAVGEVRYHYRYLEGDGMGIRFLRLSGDDLARITQFVHARIG